MYFDGMKSQIKYEHVDEEIDNLGAAFRELDEKLDTFVRWETGNESS